MSFNEQTHEGLTNSDATFRGWAQGIHDALDGAGVVQTADSGQINLSTVSMPGTNTDAGYEIWRFNDSEQSTDPVFFKLVYGIGGGSGVPSLKLSVGTGSDGSGTLANASTEIVTGPLVAGYSSQGYTAASYFKGELAVVHSNYSSYTGASNNASWALGRLRLPDGSSPGAGSLYVIFNSGAGYGRWGGTWSSSVTSLVDHASAVAGGAAMFGRVRLAQYPMPGVVNVAFVPPTLSGGDSGSVELPDGSTGTFKVLDYSARAWFAGTPSKERLALRSS